MRGWLPNRVLTRALAQQHGQAARCPGLAYRVRLATRMETSLPLTARGHWQKARSKCQVSNAALSLQPPAFCPRILGSLGPRHEGREPRAETRGSGRFPRRALASRPHGPSAPCQSGPGPPHPPPGSRRRTLDWLLEFERGSQWGQQTTEKAVLRPAASH